MGLIVVVEDNEHSARMAAKLLRRVGYDVLIAEDGETGLQTMFDNEPDLVLLDLGLPDIDGQTVIGLARQQPHLATKPIIAFTAWPTDRAAEMAKTYGCDGVITKPINTRTFAEQVEAFLSPPSESDAEKIEEAPKEEEKSVPKVKPKTAPLVEAVSDMKDKPKPVIKTSSKDEAKVEPVVKTVEPKQKSETVE